MLEFVRCTDVVEVSKSYGGVSAREVQNVGKMPRSEEESEVLASIELDDVDKNNHKVELHD